MYILIRRNRFFRCGVFFTVLTLSPFASAAVDLETYLEQRLEASPTLKADFHKMQQQIALAEAQIAPYKTSLSGNLSYFDNTESLNDQSDFGLISELKLSQSLPTGTEFSLSQKNYDYIGRSSPSALFKRQSISVSQDLYSNLLGRKTFYGQENRDVEIQLAQLSYKLSFQDECVEALNDFIKTYRLQEQRNLLKSQYDLSQEVHNQIKSLHGRKLISRLDYLSSETDLLNMKNTWNDNELESVKALQETLSYVQAEMESLASPEAWFMQRNLEGASEQTSYKQDYEELTLKSDQYQAYVEKENSRPEVKGFVEWSQDDSQTPTVRLDYNTWLAGVRFDWTVFGNTNADSYRAAKAKEAQQEKIWMESKRLDQVERSNLKAELRLFREGIETLKRQLQLSQQKLREAQRLLGAARMEFYEYSTHRDALLNSEKNLIEKMAALWNSQVQYAALNKHIELFCKDKLNAQVD